MSNNNSKRNSEILLENITELTQMLQQMNDFNFDIFKFDEICRKNSLYYYTFEFKRIFFLNGSLPFS